MRPTATVRPFAAARAPPRCIRILAPLTRSVISQPRGATTGRFGTTSSSPLPGGGIARVERLGAVPALAQPALVGGQPFANAVGNAVGRCRGGGGPGVGAATACAVTGATVGQAGWHQPPPGTASRQPPCG